MVNLKTKVDKHANDNEKRRKSIKEREKAKSNQSQIIKQALSNSLLGNNSSKKIVFDDINDDVEIRTEGPNSCKKNNDNGKPTLFESSDSEADDFEIKEKSQFTGKKGFELLNLQSTYGNDERFKIDERFLEEEKEEVDEGDAKTPVEIEANGEKAKQLKILESVLGASIISPEKEKKVKKRTLEMVRYDVSNKDHEIYEINNQAETKKLTPSKKRKEKIKTPKEKEKEDSPTPKVSKEKFYEVSNEIRNCFKEKNEESGQFSLLKTYALNDVDKNKEFEEDSDDFPEENVYEDKNNCTFKMAYEVEDKLMEEPKPEEKVMLAKGIWKESFFFVQDDPRLKEGLDFINKKNSKEANEAAEIYDKTRKRLKEIFRLHVKKQMHRKDPFKNKIGGMNKKQLAGSKSKSHNVGFNNRKKKNFAGRT